MLTHAGIDDYLIANDVKKFKAIIAAAVEPELRYKMLSCEDVCNQPPMEWLLHNVLPKNGLATIYGPSGAGKGFLAISLARAVAGGATRWFGLRVKNVPVTYVCLEGAGGLNQRIKADEKLSGNLPKADLHFVTQPFDLLTDDVGELARAITAAGGTNGMIIIDTLSRATPGMDENSNMEMMQAVAAAQRLQELVGGLIVLIHHSGKDESREERGASALKAALDASIRVTRDKTTNCRSWISSKVKDAADGETFSFELKIKEVGRDEYGEPVTSCVVNMLDNQSKQAVKQSKLEDNADLIWQRLTTELAKGHRYSQSELVNLGTGISRDDLREVAHMLIKDGRVEELPKPKTGKRGSSGRYLHPVERPTKTPRTIRAQMQKEGQKRAKY